MERVLAELTHEATAPNPVPRATRWGDLRLRVASALVLAPIALACLWVGGRAWYGLVAIAFVGVCWEWRQMATRAKPWLKCAGFAYAALATASLAWLRVDPVEGFSAVLFLLGVVWCSDIGAYAAGRLIGGRRLAPAISPGKTWSGAAGGLAAAVLGGLVAAPVGYETWHAAAIAALLGTTAQAGDLAESALKRHFGVKDSGRLIPGHGGLLDRLDGLMAAAPIAAVWILIMGRGDALWI